MKSGNLTDREGRFVEEYLVDLNATQAAIRAGYSPHTARQIGSLNLSKVDIAAAISTARLAIASRNEFSVDDLVRDLRARLNADLADIFGPNQRVLPVDQWPPVWRRGLVTAFKVRESVNESGTVSYGFSLRFADRTRIIELLGRHLGAFR